MSELSKYYHDSYIYTEYSSASAKGNDTESTSTGVGLLMQDDGVGEKFTIGNDAQAFKFFLDEDISIKRGNKITINGDNYTIAGVKDLRDLENDIDSHLMLVIYR